MEVKLLTYLGNNTFSVTFPKEPNPEQMIKNLFHIANYCDPDDWHGVVLNLIESVIELNDEKYRPKEIQFKLTISNKGGYAVRSGRIDLKKQTEEIAENLKSIKNEFLEAIKIVSEG